MRCRHCQGFVRRQGLRVKGLGTHNRSVRLTSNQTDTYKQQGAHNRGVCLIQYRHLNKQAHAKNALKGGSGSWSTFGVCAEDEPWGAV